MLERFLELPHASGMRPQARIMYSEMLLRSCCIASVSKTEVLETATKFVSKTCSSARDEAGEEGFHGREGKEKKCNEQKETIKRNPAPDPTGKANIFWGKTPCGEGDEGSREERQGRGSLGHIPRGWEISL